MCHSRAGPVWIKEESSPSYKIAGFGGVIVGTVGATVEMVQNIIGTDVSIEDVCLPPGHPLEALTAPRRSL